MPHQEARTKKTDSHQKPEQPPKPFTNTLNLTRGTFPHTHSQLKHLTKKTNCLILISRQLIVKAHVTRPNGYIHYLRYKKELSNSTHKATTSRDTPQSDQPDAICPTEKTPPQRKQEDIPQKQTRTHHSNVLAEHQWPMHVQLIKTPNHSQKCN